MNRSTGKILAIIILLSIVSGSNAGELIPQGKIALIKFTFIDTEDNILFEKSESDRYLFNSLNDLYKNRIIDFDRTQSAMMEHGVIGNSTWFNQYSNCLGCPKSKYPFSDISKKNNWAFLIAIPLDGGGQYIISATNGVINDVHMQFYRISYIASLVLIKADTGEVISHIRLNKVSEGSVPLKDWESKKYKEMKWLVTEAVNDMVIELKNYLQKQKTN